MGRLAIHPATPERWGDLERLFGPSGAYSGCWCLFWRVSSAEFAGCQGYMGLASTFRRAGFVEAAPPVRGQVVMRRVLT